MAAIIEFAGTGRLEQVTEQLNLLNAQLGCTLHQPPWRRQEEEQYCGQGEVTRGRSREPHAEDARKGDAPTSGRWKCKSQDGANGGGPVEQRAAEPRNAEEDRREAKLAARARGDGSTAAMETDPKPAGEYMDAARGTAAAAEAARQPAADGDAKKQRALDAIRGRIQLEKHRKLAEKQRELIAAGILPEPHEWTEEQLRQNQRQIEISNAEVDAEVEREFAAMSSEAIAQLLEAAAR